MMNKTKQIIKTCCVVWIYNLIWMTLELLFYREIQPRIVDDIMMLIITPMIYKALEGGNDDGR